MRCFGHQLSASYETLAARNRSNSNVANFKRSFMRVVFHETQSSHNESQSAAIVE